MRALGFIGNYQKRGAVNGTSHRPDNSETIGPIRIHRAFLRVAVNFEETEPMTTLTNPRPELFTQNLATGMSIGKSYTAAGYKATGHSAESAGARLLTIVEVQSRVAELQGSTAELITDLRDAARRYTKEAIDLYVTAMRDETLGMRIRLAAAKELIDRGHGKATQHVDREPNVYDTLSYEDQRALIAAIEAIQAEREDGGDGPAPAHY